MTVPLQAFLFPQFTDGGNLWRVSYERLGAKTIDEARGLSNTIDTEAYYKALTADGTTSGALMICSMQTCSPAYSLLILGIAGHSLCSACFPAGVTCCPEENAEPFKSQRHAL